MPRPNPDFLRAALAALEAVESDSEGDIEEQPRQVQRPGRAPQLVIPYRQFNFSLDNIDDATCEAQLRFTKQEIRSIMPYLQLDLCPFSCRYKPSPELAFSIVLARISYPHRLKDQMDFFGRSRSYISVIYCDVVEYLVDRFDSFMFWDKDRMSMETLRRYCEAIGEECVWGFIDGTTSHICRPSIDQKKYFSGHKRYHAIKHQAVVTPDGILSSLAGPIEGSRGDWLLYQRCGLERKIAELFEENQIAPENRVYLYGDPAYTGSIATMGAFKRRRNGQLTVDEAWTNRVMSKKRMAVEHFFGHVQRYFRLSSYYLQNRLCSQPLAATYLVACLMANCMTCLRGNQISQHYNCPPPTLEQYFRGIQREGGHQN